jgi:transcriptional regulator with XRE-family HTH domain
MTMRISPLRHPLAILRCTVGLTQQEMGDLVQRAAVTIQAVELGKLPLSEGLAQRIADATGADVGWLLDANPDAPAVTSSGAPYTRADFEWHRSGRETPTSAGEDRDRQLISAVAGLLQATVESPDRELIRWKLRRLLASLADDESSGTRRAVAAKQCPNRKETMKTNRSEMWEEVMAAGERVAAAYRELLQAADDLSEVVGYNEDYVLRRVLPKTPGGRRESNRVLNWLNDERGHIEAQMLAWIARREEAAQRTALLAKLNLTADEQRLLGITGKQ